MQPFYLRDDLSSLSLLGACPDSMLLAGSVEGHPHNAPMPNMFLLDVSSR